MSPLAPSEPSAPVASSRRTSVRTQRWMRWLHVYTSMISLLLVLFFGITGLTLNHPDWTFGDDVDTTTVTGSLPAGLLPAGDETVDFLSVSEYVRATYGVGGSVADHGLTGTTGTIAYKAAGYAADLRFDTATGELSLVVEQQGFVGVMNDLHKGRDTTATWRWVIDVAAVFLVVVAVSGLVVQLVYRKRRRSALTLAGAFAVVGVVLLVIGRG